MYGEWTTTGFRGHDSLATVTNTSYADLSNDDIAPKAIDFATQVDLDT